MRRKAKKGDIVWVGRIVLPTGVSLVSATKDELMEAAEFYREQADDMLKKAKFLEHAAKIKVLDHN